MATNVSAFLPPLMLGVGVLFVSGIREQFAMQPRAPMAAVSNVLDRKTGKDLVVPADEQKIAGMSDYTLRSFGTDSSPDFTVYVGYYDRQVQGKTIHSPKNCLPGAGWEILTNERIPLPGGRPEQSINRVILSNRGIRALVYYWYQGRGRTEASEYRVKWNLLRDAALFGRTEETLVRIVVPVAAGRTMNGPLRDDPAIRAAISTADRVAPVLAEEVQRVLPVAPGE